MRRACDGVEPVVAVRADPALHEAAAAAKHLLDVGGLEALDGQNNGAKTIALLGIALYSRPALQGVKISRVAFDEVHASASVPSTSSHAAANRATPTRAKRARGNRGSRIRQIGPHPRACHAEPEVFTPSLRLCEGSVPALRNNAVN